tara:strand:+ start:10590 stop:11732 length:1143 start_codon:yes stop_codon:yes gene_type:complete
MNIELLSKGFEVELFTGLSTGEHVGVASAIIEELDQFVKEPDQRNIEFITSPEKKYSSLKESLLSPRRKLREWLALRHLTILPGSTLNLGNSKRFERSDSLNTYHDLIEKNYGTNVVTASVHINLGIEDLPSLFAALRLVRCEASLFLALSASSPFLDGSPTGMHSQRWIQFPRTPKEVPFFINHDHYVNWIENNLANGVMWNERHFWSSVRPNGPRRPYELNRLELRICDLIINPDLLIAVTALLELRILSLIQHMDQLDPLKVSKLNMKELAALSDLNDVLAAKSSLDASLNHWIDGKPIVCRDWIADILDNVSPLATTLGMTHVLLPIYSVLENGNQAMTWLKEYANGASVQKLIQESISIIETEEITGTNQQAPLG